MKKIIILSICLATFQLSFAQKFGIGILSGIATMNNSHENDNIIYNYNNGYMPQYNAPYFANIVNIETGILKTKMIGGYFEIKRVSIEVNAISNAYAITELVGNPTYDTRIINVNENCLNICANYKLVKHYFVIPYLGAGIQSDNFKITDNFNQVSNNAKLNFLLNAGIESTLFKRLLLRTGYTYSINRYINFGIGICF